MLAESFEGRQAYPHTHSAPTTSLSSIRKMLGEMSIAVSALVSLPSCSAPQSTALHYAAWQENIPESIADADILARRMLPIEGKEEECTLFTRGDEIRLRAGRCEYVILGTSGAYGIPIPFTAAMAKSAEGGVTIESEEGMTCIVVNVPKIAEGTLVLRDKDITGFVAGLNDAKSEKDPIVMVSGGSMHIANMYDANYNDSPCVLRMRKVAKK